MHRSPHRQGPKQSKEPKTHSACLQLSTSQTRANTWPNGEKFNTAFYRCFAHGCGEQRKALTSSGSLWAYPVDKVGNIWGQPKRLFQLRGYPQTNSPNDGRRLFSFESLKTMKGILLWGERKCWVLYFCFVLPRPQTTTSIFNSTSWLITTIHPDRATRTNTTSPAPSKSGSSSAW